MAVDVRCMQDRNANGVGSAVAALARVGTALRVLTDRQVLKTPASPGLSASNITISVRHISAAGCYLNENGATQRLTKIVSVTLRYAQRSFPLPISAATDARDQFSQRPGYDEARKVYNGMILKPRLIARCADVADVIAR